MIRLSPSGCKFWGNVEGCVLHPYHGAKDAPGVMTIYYGHVIRSGDDIVPPYTQEKADYWLGQDTAWMQAWLWRHCPWSNGDPTDPASDAYGRQHNFDALCSMVGNAGHVFDDVLAEVNGANRPDEIKRLWMLHTRAGDDPKALVFRRAQELGLYLTPDVPTDTIDRSSVLASVYMTSRQIVAEYAGGSPLPSENDHSPPTDRNA